MKGFELLEEIEDYQIQSRQFIKSKFFYVKKKKTFIRLFSYWDFVIDKAWKTTTVRIFHSFKEAKKFVEKELLEQRIEKTLNNIINSK